MIDWLPQPPPGYWHIVAAVFLGSVPAFILAAWQRRGPRYLNQVSELEQPEEVEEMGEIYEQQVLPLQVEHHKELVDKLRKAARELGAYGKEVTSDDVHAKCPIPAGVDPRVMGAAFPKADWVRVRSVKSNRAVNHGRFISSWKRKDSAA